MIHALIFAKHKTLVKKVAAIQRIINDGLITRWISLDMRQGLERPNICLRRENHESEKQTNVQNGHMNGRPSCKHQERQRDKCEPEPVTTRAVVSDRPPTPK